MKLKMRFCLMFESSNDRVVGEPKRIREGTAGESSPQTFKAESPP